MPAPTERDDASREKLYASRNLIPVVILIVARARLDLHRHRDRDRGGGVRRGRLAGRVARCSGSLTWDTFRTSLLGATRLYCMIALILAGASFLTLAMGYIGLPRHLAEWISSLGLSQFWLLMALMVFFIILGCFLDGISMVVLTMGVILPTVQKAGIDLIWFGIFVVLVVEMAQITPPVGFNLFVLQGMTEKQITWIAKHTLPMFYLMIVAMLLTYFFPGLVTWLPEQMMSK